MSPHLRAVRGVLALAVGALVVGTGGPALAGPLKPTTISENAATIATVGSLLSVTGKVSPKVSGLHVTIQHCTGVICSLVKTTSVDSSGHYSVAVRMPPSPQAYLVRVYRPATSTVAAGFSPVRTVQVVEPAGTVLGFGSNGHGQLGDNSSAASSLVPVSASGLSDVKSVAAGWGGPDGATLALRTDGTVWAWGDNTYGQLGNGTTTSSHGPVQVPGLRGVVAVAAGHDASYALLGDGTVMAWGRNDQGQLGNGFLSTSLVPVRVTGLTAVTAISAGGETALALRSDGTVWLWGSNLTLFEPSSGPAQTPPAPVAALTNVKAIGSGYSTAYAIKTDGTLWKLGARMGDAVPAVVHQVSGVTNAVAATGNEWADYALLSTGRVMSWANVYGGMLGNGTHDTNTSGVVSNLTTVVAISSSWTAGYALLASGQLYAWGEGELGNPTNGNTTALTPVQVPGITHASAVTAAKGAFVVGPQY